MPTKLTALEELSAAIRTAAKEALPNVASRQAAEEFYATHSGQIEPFVREWAIEKLASLIRWHRAKLSRDSKPQYAFEKLLGFKRLPQRIVLKSGEQVARESATLGQWREFRSRLYDQGHPLLEQADRVIAMMEKYTPKQRTISYGDALSLEAEKAQKKK